MKPGREQLSELMNLAAAGCDDSFGLLATASQDDLFRFALANGLSRTDAAEATQETLLRAYRGRKSWKTDGNAMAWLYGITMNVVRELRRKKRPDISITQHGWDLPAPQQDTFEGALQRQQLAAGLEALPQRQREAVACRYLRGMSVRETAETMGIAEGTVKATVHAALKALRESLGT